ncbi:hypothetical protein Dimus_013758 [Dionaea muscipula]
MERMLLCGQDQVIALESLKFTRDRRRNFQLQGWLVEAGGAHDLIAFHILRIIGRASMGSGTLRMILPAVEASQNNQLRMREPWVDDNDEIGFGEGDIAV